MAYLWSNTIDSNSNFFYEYKHFLNGADREHLHKMPLLLHLLIWRIESFYGTLFQTDIHHRIGSSQSGSSRGVGRHHPGGGGQWRPALQTITELGTWKARERISIKPLAFSHSSILFQTRKKNIGYLFLIWWVWKGLDFD